VTVTRPRLPAHLLAASLCAGLAFADVTRVHMLAFAASALAGAALVAVQSPALRLALTAVFLCGCGWWWGGLRLDTLDRSPLSSRVGEAGRAVVEVRAPPTEGQFGIRAEGRLRSFEGDHVREQVLLELPVGRSPPQGAVLDVLARIQLPRGPSHGFDERTWLRRRGVHVVLRVDDWHLVGARAGLGAVADRLHTWLARDSAAGLTGERRTIVAAIVLGDSHDLDAGLLDRFQASGLYHVLAVDGLKVTAVAGGAVGLAFLLGAGRLLAELAALVAVGCYVLGVGARPSVVRAALAAALVSLAWLTARQSDRWHALLVAAAALLAWNPYFVFDAGFQLSFGAVAGIFTIAPRIVRKLEGYPLPRSLNQLIGVSTACGIATAPVTWIQFHQVSLVTVPANVVGVPIVAEMLGIALLTALLAPVAPPVAVALGHVNGLGASLLAAWARLTGGLPFAQISSARAADAVGACALVATYAWWRCRTS
jgi:competence protein ComEC